MDDSTRTLLVQRIENEFENLDSMVDGEDKQKAINNLVALYKLKIEEEKIDAEYSKHRDKCNLEKTQQENDVKIKNKDIELKARQIEVESEIKNKDIKLKTQQIEVESEIKNKDIELKTQQIEVESEIKNKDIELKARQIEVESEIKNKDIELKARQIEVESEIKNKDIELKARQIEVESDDRLHELELKKAQLDEQKLDKWVNLGMQVGLSMLSIVAYDVWNRRGLKFEETGTITSPMTRNLLSKMLPKR